MRHITEPLGTWLDDLIAAESARVAALLATLEPDRAALAAMLAEVAEGLPPTGDQIDLDKRKPVAAGNCDGRGDIKPGGLICLHSV